MEHFISFAGLAAGLVGIVSSILSRVRVSFKSNSIEIKFGHQKGDPEIKIDDISKISKSEIDEIISRIEAIEMEGNGVRRVD